MFLVFAFEESCLKILNFCWDVVLGLTFWFLMHCLGWEVECRVPYNLLRSGSDALVAREEIFVFLLVRKI